jgi:hypothetical protein
MFDDTVIEDVAIEHTTSATWFGESNAELPCHPACNKERYYYSGVVSEFNCKGTVVRPYIPVQFGIALFRDVSFGVTYSNF